MSVTQVSMGKLIPRQGLSTEGERHSRGNRRCGRDADRVRRVCGRARGRENLHVGLDTACRADRVPPYAGMTRKVRRRQRILGRPFPAEREAVLQLEVLFLCALASAKSKCPRQPSTFGE